MQKVALISRGPVGPDFNGGAMTVWGLVTEISKKKDISLDLILFFQDLKNKNDIQNTKNYLDKIKVNYHFYQIDEKKNKKIFLKNLLKFNYSYFFQTYKIKKEVNKKLNTNKYDLIYTYHWDALSLINKKLKNKTVALLGDQMHEPRIFRRRILKYNILKRYLMNTADNVFFKIVEYQLIKGLKNVYYFAYYYSLKKTFYKKQYLNTPIEDNYNNNKIEVFLKNKYESEDSKNDIYLMGGLHGTVTISGLIFLKNYIINNKTTQLFNFNIIGQGSLIDELKILLNFKNVKFIGRIEDLSEIFNKKKFLLVPNTITLGIRIRILTALMFGLIVITHESNLSGIPELHSKQNCLVFNSQDDFKKLLEEIHTNKINLTKIALNARLTFKKYYNNIEIVDKLINSNQSN